MLTRREKAVLSLICDGLTCKEIAHELGIAYKTVDCHRTNLMRKLDIHNAAALVQWAVQNGRLAA